MFVYELRMPRKIADRRPTFTFLPLRVRIHIENSVRRHYDGYKMCRLERLLVFMLLFILVESNQEKQVK